MIPAIEQFLARIQEIDDHLLAQQELMERCQAEAIRDGALAATHEDDGCRVQESVEFVAQVALRALRPLSRPAAAAVRAR